MDNRAENWGFLSVTDPNKAPASVAAKSYALSSVCGHHYIIVTLDMFSKDSYLADGRQVPYELQPKVCSRYGNVRTHFYADEQLLV